MPFRIALVVGCLSSAAITSLAFIVYVHFARRQERFLLAQRIASDIYRYANNHHSVKRGIVTPAFAALMEAIGIAEFHGDHRHSWVGISGESRLAVAHHNNLWRAAYRAEQPETPTKGNGQ